MRIRDEKMIVMMMVKIGVKKMKTLKDTLCDV